MTAEPSMSNRTFEEIKMPDQLMTLRHWYRDGGGEGQRGGWGECDSLRPGEEVMPGIYMCVCLCTHTHIRRTHNPDAQRCSMDTPHTQM